MRSSSSKSYWNLLPELVLKNKTTPNRNKALSERPKLLIIA
ncbi:hypothetical protein BTN50_0249 [Candidatus Enterovibrio altilux]|uniref:Uncharacterized protein n=1 Tax=Candidatus Enterovibrio altilux TaxID=1927128 RepID=A0A291B717_9GAMM|nr:hypothetical protein BTN50_0249 [Candidatus Enterovibrio luxaltus]